MKLKVLIKLTLFLFCYSAFGFQGRSYVTYQLPLGRLGDKLVSYIHAKWLAYKFGLKMLYRPFEYSDKLMLSKIDEPFGRINRSYYGYIRPYKGSKPNYYNKSNVLFEICYFPECQEELIEPHPYYHFSVNYKDPEFKALLQKAISPIVELDTIKPPKDCISLAVQVRRNSGGFDYPLSFEVIEKLGYLPEGKYTDFIYPLKHPSDDYYIEQIKKASEFFNHQQMYLFIFTDDPKPALIVEKYRELLKDYNNIKFDYRKSDNGHQFNVLEDLFSITNFDAFIRPASNLGFVASIIGNFKLVISPKTHKKEGNKIIIDSVDFQTSSVKPTNDIKPR